MVCLSDLPEPNGNSYIIPGIVKWSDIEINKTVEANCKIVIELAQTFHHFKFK